MSSDPPLQLKPRLTISFDQVQSIIGRIFPQASVLDVAELHGGEIGTVLEIMAADSPACVLKAYPASLQWKMAKEGLRSGLLRDVDDAPKREGLLAGYGKIERPLWCWMAQIGKREALADLTRELSTAS
ncbi:hypothetical protein [Bradyrhizobium vignae]|nr:hypothetical protein [Bradyrhizobium vignae]